VPPIFISLLVAVFFLVPRNRSQAQNLESNPESSLGAEFVDFFRSSAVVLSTCIAITVLINIGQWFYEYGISTEQPVPRTAAQLFLPVIQAFISVAVCLFTTWYLVSASTHPPRRGLSFTATLLAIVAATALVGFFYEITFVRDYVHARPQAAPGWDHVLFGVIANVLVSVCAFSSIALFFTTREKLPKAVRAHYKQSAAPPKGKGDRKRPLRERDHIGHRANTHLNGSRHVSH
jgi:hypothetical protein